jgi:single-stranded-DNA-specific exonuclease RecJ
MTGTAELLPQNPQLARQLADELSISPVLAQILINRGLTTSAQAELFLMGGYDDLLDPELLEGLSEAADIVAEAVRDGVRIVIHGDYDADGVSATALLVSFLRDMGALVEPYIPHRIDEGYGLSREGILWASEERFGVLVSVDCGSSSPDEVALARSLGMKVVITDHHMVGDIIPDADAFVNPRRPGSTYPFPFLSGAGVAFKLVMAVSARLGRGTPQEYLDLAAIGTVGDVVPLTGENRILVREGLEVMARLERPGLAALARVAGLLDNPNGHSEQPAINAIHIGFQLAPRINACGRLEHARTAAELLLERNHVRAEELATQIDLLNQKRREAEATLREEAEAMVLRRGTDGITVIVEGSPDWHQGIVGITANRLLDRFGVPAFVISIAPDGSAKGSARGPANLDLFAAMTACKDLFTHYGGHPRAGGFSMRAADIDALRDRLASVIPTLLGPPEPRYRIDVDLPLAAANLDLAEELECLAPLGHGNPAPLFMARAVRLRFPEVVKERHLKFQASQHQASARCIAFGLAERLDSLDLEATHDLPYELRRDMWRDEARLSFIVKDVISPPRQRRDQPDVTVTEGGIPWKGGPVAPTLVVPREAGDMLLYDARSVENRGRYLADLVRSGKALTVVARRTLLDFAARVMAPGRGASNVPSHVQLLAYGDTMAVNSRRVVLFSPPPSLEIFAALLQASDECHVLFGHDELREEEAVLRSLRMTRDRVAAVYKMLLPQPQAPAAGQRFSTASFGMVVNRLGHADFGLDTIKVVVRILCELDLARDVGRGEFEMSGGRAELEGSPTYQRYAAFATSFTAVQQMFAPVEGLDERLRAYLAAPVPA